MKCYIFKKTRDILKKRKTPFVPSEEYWNELKRNTRIVITEVRVSL